MLHNTVTISLSNLLHKAIRCSVLCADDEARWRHDPLSHPAIRKMSVRELADLPIDATL